MVILTHSPCCGRALLDDYRRQVAPKARGRVLEIGLGAGARVPSAFIDSGATFGYAVGALAAGLIADQYGLAVAIAAIAALTFVSGVVVAISMQAKPTPAAFIHNGARHVHPKRTPTPSVSLAHRRGWPGPEGAQRQCLPAVNSDR